MAFDLTEEQKAVVDDRGGRLLVAAAAGSGKTRVLVERLLERIDPVSEDGLECPNAANVTDFLVITFTNEAAAELKHRIALEIRTRIKEGSANVRHLSRQLALLPQANISTIHSFCGEVIREHGHKIDINPGFTLLDKGEAESMKQDVLDDLLELWYSKEDNEEFLQLVDTLAPGRDDEKLKKMIRDVYEKIQSHPDPALWLKEQKNMWIFPENMDLMDTHWGKFTLNTLREEMSLYLPLLKKANEAVEGNEQAVKKYEKAFKPAIEGMEKLAAAIEKDAPTWDEVASVSAVEFNGISTAPLKDEDLKHYLSGTYSKVRDGVRLLKLAPQSQLLSELQGVAPGVQVLMEVVQSFSDLYDLTKKAKSTLDYGDLEHKAVKLLLDEHGNASDIASLYGEKFLEVMVDEFQDTNQVQNVIFNSVSQQSTRLFIVGDAKQAIYLFRLADPSIFAEIFNSRTPLEPKDHSTPVGEPRNRMLQCNFRSRKEVLFACNDFFVETMTPELGGSDYRKHGMLVPGATFPPHPDTAYYDTELNFLEMDEWDFTEIQDKAEVEAIWVAKRVRKLLDDQFLLSDPEGEGLCPVKPKDIMVLLRSVKMVLGYYYKAFREEGIALVSTEGEDLFERREVDVAHGFLKIIDNPQQDLPLLAVLTSPLFSFSPEDLTILRQGSTGSFYQALVSDQWMEVLEHSQLDLGDDVASIVEPLKKKRDAFLALLKKFRQASWEKSPRDLLWYVYEECHFMGIFGGLTQGEERQEILSQFHRVVGDLEDSGYSTLFRLLAQLEELKEVGELPKCGSRSTTEGAVSILTVHKSKGLEKPVVIVAGLDKKFSTKDQEKPLVFHQDYGVGPTGLDREKRILFPTLARNVVIKVQKKEQISEELRLLYVAMTRAREKLILAIAVKDGIEKKKKTLELVSKPLNPTYLTKLNSLGGFLTTYALIRPEGGELLHKMDDGAVIEPDSDWKPEFNSQWDIRLVNCGKEIQGVGAEDEESQEEGFMLEESAEKEPVPLANTDEKTGADLDQLKEKCAERFAWKYPYEGDALIPSKFTATQTKGRKLVFDVTEEAETEENIKKMERSPNLIGAKQEEITYPPFDDFVLIPIDEQPEAEPKTVVKEKRQPSFLQEREEGLDPAARGTAIHLVMQYLNLATLKDFSLESLAAFLSTLVSERKISHEQAKVVSPEQLVAFLQSPWGEAIRESSYCKQEFKFSLLMEGKKLGFETEESLLLQGVVDCFYKNKEGNIVIIDFKSDRISHGKLEEKAKEHENQMKTYEEALFRMTGCPVVEKVLWFFSINEGVLVQ